MSTDERERRQFVRLTRQFRIEISPLTFPLSDVRPVEVTGVDISEGGVAVQCSQEFGVGEKVQVRIYIPKLHKYHPGFLKVFDHDLGQYIMAVAETAWCRRGSGQDEYILGLEFVDVYEDDLQALHNVIRSGLAV